MMPLSSLARNQVRNFLRALLGGLGGVVLLFGGLFLIQPLLPPRSLRSPDLLSFGAALICLVMGIVLTYVHLIRPEDAPMPRARLAQVANLVLGAVALLLPIIGESFLAPGPAFMLVVVLYLTSTAVAWKIWREADELMRAILRDTSAVAFCVTAPALAIYASGERLGVLSGGTAWGFLGFVLLVSLMCSGWAVYRHGADQLPADR